MPKPSCIQCSSNDSLLWRKQESGQICNECYLAQGAGREGRARGEGSEEEDAGGDGARAAAARVTRKSTRATRYKPAPALTPAAPATAPAPPGPPAPRSRRAAAKRPPLRAPSATATLVTSQHVFYKGVYMQAGDVVSVRDVDGGRYFAQIRALLTDQYCEKSAALTWLLPTRASPPPEQGFHPATYIIGPEEELPRKLEYMEWVMHAPSDYYRATCTPYPPTEEQLGDSSGFIWTAMEPVPVPASQT